jgi:hypothetical protein
MYEEHVQGLKEFIDSVDTQKSSIDWARVKYSLIIGSGKLEIFYDEESFESRKFELIMEEKNPNFTTHTHLP